MMTVFFINLPPYAANKRTHHRAKMKFLSLFQNSVSFEKGFIKTGIQAGFYLNLR